ncbi:MAG: hypothetical protein CMJ31_09850, partial [Phycisphaerae bacterium]|nr:hypothetical protein [Phycisphaerae bacterium]
MTAATTEFTPATERIGEPATWQPTDRFLRLVPRDFARQHLIFSRAGDDEVESLVIADSTPIAAPLNVRARLGVAVTTDVVDGEVIAAAIDAHYAAVENANSNDPRAPAETEAADVDRLLAVAERDLLSTSGKGDVVRLVDALLFESLQRGASDLHIQPLEDRALVRMRVDGVLRLVRELPEAFTAPITSRVKVMGRMDIAER